MEQALVSEVQKLSWMKSQIQVSAHEEVISGFGNNTT